MSFAGYEVCTSRRASLVAATAVLVVMDEERDFVEHTSDQNESSIKRQSSSASVSCIQSFHNEALGRLRASGFVSSPAENQPPYFASIRYFFTYSQRRTKCLRYSVSSAGRSRAISKNTLIASA